MDVGDLADKLPVWALLVIVAAPGLWAVWKQRVAGQETGRRERADLVKIAQEAATSVIGDLRAEINRLQRQVEELEGEMMQLRKEHAETVSAKDAKITLLEGQVRQWMALAHSYEQKLTQAGIDHEQPRQPFWGLPAGEGPSEMAEGRLP